MLAQKFSVRSEEENAAVERAALAFNHADHQIDGVGARSFAEGFYCRPWNFHRALKVALEVFTAFRGAPADHCAEIETARIAGDKRFRKERQLCALPGRVCGEVENFGQGPLAVKRH